MKISIRTIIVLLFILLISCNNESRNGQSDIITVKGNIKEFDGEILYAKIINPISYHSNSLIDSTLVESNGDFEFNISRPLPLLLSLSKYGGQHLIHKLLQEDPYRYSSGYCAMFYVPEPTLYLAENSNVKLDWTVADRIDSYSYDKVTTENQGRFYNYYLKENFGRWLHKEDGNLILMDPQIAWEKIEEEVKETLATYELGNNAVQNQFNNYLKTEIIFGAVNKYLNWYEYVFYEDLKRGFVSGDIPELYTEIINMFEDSKWNTDSVEFYKMTERFVTYNVNKSIKWFQNYYPTDDRKISMARKVLEPELADKYVENISLSNSIN